jgi:glucose dehydrogenase
MRLRQTTFLCGVAALGALVLAAGSIGVAQQAPPRSPDADWPTYNRDLAGTRYSPLTQINTGNVTQLKEVWTYLMRPPAGVPVPAVDQPASSFEIFQQVTPIVVNGVMYLPSGNRVVALEPETGKEIWRHELSEGLASFRGLTYWPGDGTVPARILFTSLKKLMALDAKTGKPDIEFGTNGHVDLDIAYAGAPVIHKNVIVMGSNMFGPGMRHIGPHLTTSKGEIADTHAYDARTGKKLWTFHNIPRPGEFGNDTWLNDSWKDRTGNNVWSFTLTLDEQRGLVYLPISGPGMNYYGGDRPGNNLFSNSTVALDVQTGKMKWFFQNIHHEMWDYNLPPAPGLIDIVKDGRTIPALAQVGKSGWMFILNRETGEPVHGVEERPVAKGDVPGEWYPPTQPFPVKPGPLARVSMAEKDLVTAEDTNAAHAAACKEIWDRVKFRNDGPYTPWNYRPNGGPPSVVFPGMTGGVNWGGTATDPKLGYIFVNSKDEPSYGWIQPNPRYNEQTKDTEFPYSQVGGGGTLAAPMRDGERTANIPCFRPPWASLMAVNAATGEFVWRVPLGINENMPAGKQNVGSPGYGGPMVTAGGLVFIGATADRYFRAFDSRTGKELWSVRFPNRVTAVPISYQGKDGKQYVAVVAARDGERGQEALRVFALP